MKDLDPAQIMLTDGVVSLRPVQPPDIGDQYAAVRESLAELKPWMSWAHDDIAEADVRDFIESAQKDWSAGRAWHFSIRDATNGKLLGVCGLSHYDEGFRLANLGYWVRTNRTRQGIASRATRLLARFGFERLDLVRVEVVVLVDNHASLRAAEKAGAKREGVLRNRMVVRGEAYDAVMHSLTPGEFGIEALYWTIDSAD